MVCTHFILKQKPWKWKNCIRGLTEKGDTFAETNDESARAFNFIRGINRFLMQKLSDMDCVTIKMKIEDRNRRKKTFLSPWHTIKI